MQASHLNFEIPLSQFGLKFVKKTDWVTRHAATESRSRCNTSALLCLHRKSHLLPPSRVPFFVWLLLKQISGFLNILACKYTNQICHNLARMLIGRTFKGGSRKNFSQKIIKKSITFSDHLMYGKTA